MNCSVPYNVCTLYNVSEFRGGGVPRQVERNLCVHFLSTATATVPIPGAYPILALFCQCLFLPYFANVGMIKLLLAKTPLLTSQWAEYLFSTTELGILDF